MRFAMFSKKDLIKKINELDDIIEKDNQTIHLNKSVRYASRWGNRTKTFKQYLISKAGDDLKKANKVYTALTEPTKTYADLQHELHQKRWKSTSKTAGDHILAGSAEISKKPADSKRHEFEKEAKRRPDAPNSIRADIALPMKLDTKIVDNDALPALEIFDEVEPNNYRFAVYDDLSLDPLELKLHQPSPSALPKRINQVDEETFQVSCLPIPARPGEYFPLPSITMNDYIDLQSVQTNFKFEACYSEQARQFYIKPLKNPPHDSPFMVSYPLIKGKEEYTPLKEVHEYKKYFDLLNQASFQMKKGKLCLKEGNLDEIQRLSFSEKLFVLKKFFEDFTQKDLKEAPSDKISIDTLNLILKEKVGVCRHFCFLFFAFAKVLGISNQVKIIGNDIHAFVEAFDKENQFKVDLGGGIANIKKRKHVQEFKKFPPPFIPEISILSNIIQFDDGRVLIVYNKTPTESDWSRKNFLPDRVTQYEQILENYSKNKSAPYFLPHHSANNLQYHCYEFPNQEEAAKALAELYKYDETQPFYKGNHRLLLNEKDNVFGQLVSSIQQSEAVSSQSLTRRN